MNNKEEVNHSDQIPKYAWIFLIIIAIIDLIRGGIHFFAPDGGAGIIAHFELVEGSTATAEIIYLFAIIGFTQIWMGFWYLLISFKKRELVPFAFLIEVFKSGCGIIVSFFWKAPPGEFPGKYGMIGMFIFTIGLLISIKVTGKSLFKL